MASQILWLPQILLLVSVLVEFVEVLPVMAVMARSLWLHAGTTNWP